MRGKCRTSGIHAPTPLWIAGMATDARLQGPCIRDNIRVSGSLDHFEAIRTTQRLCFRSSLESFNAR